MKSDVSAFMDDALEDGSQTAVVNALVRDWQLRQAWSEYHLIGDALRRSSRLSVDITGRVMERLAGEPALLARHPAATGRRNRLRYALPLAASVMGIGAVAWVAQTLNTSPVINVALVQRQAPVQPVTSKPVISNDGDLAQASQVNPYLFAHQWYSPVSNIQGVAPYVRIVADTRQGNAR
ncbi:MAG: sigma-E factor negative regulatory protein [Hyphomicrobiaceae bacterium]